MRTLIVVVVVIIISGCKSTASNNLSDQEKAQIVVRSDTETLCRMVMLKKSYKPLAEAELGLRNATCDWRQLKLAHLAVHYGAGMDQHRAEMIAMAAQHMSTGSMPQQTMQPVIPKVCRTTYHGSQIQNEC